MQIINDPYQSLGGGFGYSLGNALGTGLSTGLQQLAALKMQDMQQRKLAEAAGKAGKYTPEEIALLGQARNPAESIKLTQMIANMPRKSDTTAATQPSGLQNLAEVQSQPNKPEEALPLSGTPALQAQTAQQEPRLGSLPKSEHEQGAESRFNRREARIAMDKSIDAIKKPLEASQAKAEQAKELLKHIPLIRAANKTGKLIQGRDYQALKALGLDQYFIAGKPMTELAQKEFERMVLDIVTNTPRTGRMTDFMYKSMAKTTASLANSKEGVEDILRVLEIDAKTQQRYDQVLNNRKEQYKRAGIPVPSTIFNEVDKILEPYYERSNINKLKIIGEDLAKSKPELNPKNYKQGQRVKITNDDGSSYIVRLVGKSWIDDDYFHRKENEEE